MALVEVERGEGIAVITLNRPEAMNALSQALQRELSAAIVAADDDEAVRCIVLTGAGQRAFSAGLDLKEMGEFGVGKGPEGSRAPSPVTALSACRTPVIGAINGVAVTGGFELAMACDILIGSASARFADTHARVGLTPGWGLSQKLSRAIGVYRAKEMSLSGNFIDAQTALAWGLISRVVPVDDLLPVARALAGDIASCDPAMVRRYKALIDDGFAMTFADGVALEAERSSADNASVTAEAVAERRAGVQARGRGQQG